MIWIWKKPVGSCVDVSEDQLREIDQVTTPVQIFLRRACDRSSYVGSRQLNA